MATRTTVALLATILLQCLGWGAAVCEDVDWKFAFGSCSTEGTRNVFAYPEGAGAAACSSRQWPVPLLNQSCTTTCQAGTHLGATLLQRRRLAPEGTVSEPAERALTGTHAGANRVAGVISTKCEACPAGKFSLGGGFLVSGLAGDWQKTWPAVLRSTCEYYDAEGVLRMGAVRAPKCTLRVERPEMVAGFYEMSGALWNKQMLLAGPVRGILRTAPGDGQACEPLPSVADNGNLTVILLVRHGQCSPQQKALNAANAGAGAVLLMHILHGNAPVAPAWQAAGSPPVPLFAVAPADGEVLSLVLARGVAVTLSIANPKCTEEATAPENSTSDPTSGSGAGAGAGALGCEPWKAHPSGRYVYSGDNRRFNNIYSYLTMSVRLVRDGYVAFRYAVDAEVGFDGFAFTLDWNEVIAKVSQRKTYVDVHINLTKGTHVLEWQYMKDPTTSEGEDRAWLEVIEVVGTGHADLECRGCHSSHTHSTGGASRCNSCQQNEYLEVPAGGESNLGNCVSCGAGKWSLPGSVGASSCQPRKPCKEEDFEVTFTDCQSNARRQVSRLREPVICDVGAAGSVQGLEVPAESAECPPCQPNEHRPSGSECAPHRINCPEGYHSVPELATRFWGDWPKNFSEEIWTLAGDSVGEEDPTAENADEDHPHGHSWRLNEAGHFAYVGDHSVGSLETPPAVEGTFDTQVLRIGDARLHLALDMMADGNVTFTCEVFPKAAWESRAWFLVDLTQPDEMELLWQSEYRLRATVPLEKGLRRLTWMWQYGNAQVVNAGATASGLRLLNVTVVNAAGAGASRCELCTEGHMVSEDKQLCSPCPRGRSRSADQTTCEACPAGSYTATTGQTECQACGIGTSSAAGAPHCELDLKNSSRSIKVTDILNSWQSATGAVKGPYAVAGRHFLLSPFTPTLPLLEGDEEEGAYIWELVPRSSGACVPVINGAASLELADSIWSAQLAGPQGSQGILVTYAGDVPSSCSGAAEARRSTLTLLFRCDPKAVVVPGVRKDQSGVYHLPRLQLMGGAPRWDGCGDAALEWPTAAACPACSEEDYAPQPGPCESDGRRRVVFLQVVQCVGGVMAPPSYRESCGTPDEARRIHRYLKGVVAIGVVVGLGLCLYAAYLQWKYGGRDDL